MRVSVTDTPELIGNVRVTFFGRDVTMRCIEADSELGYVILQCGDMDRHQSWIFDGPVHAHQDNDEQVCTIRVNGPTTVDRTENDVP